MNIFEIIASQQKKKFNDTEKSNIEKKSGKIIGTENNCEMRDEAQQNAL